MRGWSCWVAAIGLVTGCRFGFDPHDHASGDDDAALAPDTVIPDSLVGGSCGMFTQIALGNESTCMLGANGTRWCAGANVGMGTATPSTLTRANAEQDWTALALGSTQSAGLRAGSLWAWDAASSPTLVDPSGDWQLDGQVDQFCARKSDSTLVCGGTAIAGSWISASAGTNAYCGVKSDHTLWCWGENLSNVLGQGVEPDGTMHATPAQVGTETDWKDVQVATGLACGRKTDNTMWCWGGVNYTGTNFTDTLGIPAETSGRTNWVAYWVRWHHGCAMKDTHDVECWGTDEFGLEVVAGLSSVGGSTGLGTTWDDFRSGGHHYCGQKGGLWYCWGNNDQGQLGIGTHVTQPAQTAPLCSN